MHNLNPPESSAAAVRKTPKQQRSIKLVESIIEAAARILEEGIDPFTTNHIAKRAGVSIGSLYQYFPTAESIMATLIKQHVADERSSAELILASAQDRNTDIMRDLLEGFVNAHADSPRLTAQLHALAPSFGLQEYLAHARDAQAAQIAQVLGLSVTDVQMSVMAVEGVVLATLASDPDKLKSGAFIDKLYVIAQSPLGNL